MTDKSKADAAPGQQKSHTATRVNPETGQTETREFTQAEWRDRDKAEGWTRPDEAEGTDGGDTAPSGAVN